jgi:hypothetical protein
MYTYMIYDLMSECAGYFAVVVASSEHAAQWSSQMLPVHTMSLDFKLRLQCYDMEGENRVNRLRYRDWRAGEDSRYIQGSWVPYALQAVYLDISSAEAQLGQVHMQHARS